MLPCGVTAAAVLAVEPDDEMRAQLSRLHPRLGSVLGLQSGALRVRGGRRHRGWAGISPVRLTGSTRIGRSGNRPGPAARRRAAALGNAVDESVSWVAGSATAPALPSGMVGCGFAELPEHPRLTTWSNVWLAPAAHHRLAAGHHLDPFLGLTSPPISGPPASPPCDSSSKHIPAPVTAASSSPCAPWWPE